MAERSRKIRRFHVRPCMGPRRPIEHERLFLFFSTIDLPESHEVSKEKISFVNKNLAITSQQGMPTYLEELTDEGWIACKACARGANCMSMDGIEKLMEGVPVGILMGNSVVGDPIQLMRLGLSGPTFLRGAVFAASAFAAMFDEAKRFFGTGAQAQPINFGQKNAEDYARDLEIKWPATRDEIESAFKRLAFKYHPDRNQGNKSAEEMFKCLVEARQKLLTEIESR